MWAARQPVLTGASAADAELGVSAAPWIASKQRSGQHTASKLGPFPLAQGGALASSCGTAHSAQLQTSAAGHIDSMRPPFFPDAWNRRAADVEARRSAPIAVGERGALGTSSDNGHRRVWAEQLARVEAFVA